MPLQLLKGFFAKVDPTSRNPMVIMFPGLQRYDILPKFVDDLAFVDRLLRQFLYLSTAEIFNVARTKLVQKNNTKGVYRP